MLIMNRSKDLSVNWLLKKLALIKELVTEKSYRKNFYRYTESFLKKYNIPEMNESQLDDFLHS